MIRIPKDYEERVYAGVLGKIIGVCVGRPFEGWRHVRIVKELGDQILRPRKGGKASHRGG